MNVCVWVCVVNLKSISTTRLNSTQCGAQLEQFQDTDATVVDGAQFDR